MMSARNASPIDGSRAIASAKVWRISAAETSALSSRAATRYATALSSVWWFRIVVIRKVASSGSRRIASSASWRMRASRGSLPASPTMRAVKPCAMANSWPAYSTAIIAWPPPAGEGRDAPSPSARAGGGLEARPHARQHGVALEPPVPDHRGQMQDEHDADRPGKDVMGLVSGGRQSLVRTDERRQREKAEERHIVSACARHHVAADRQRDHEQVKQAMGRLGAGVHEPVERHGVRRRPQGEPRDDPEDNQRQHCDADRLVDKQDLAARVPARQLRRPHAEPERAKDQKRHQPVQRAHEGMVDGDELRRAIALHDAASIDGDAVSLPAIPTISRPHVVARDHVSMIATARVQPAEARSILAGKQDTMKPVEGSASRLCSFSIWQ